MHLLIVFIVLVTSLLLLFVLLGVKNKSLKHREDLWLFEHGMINVIYRLLSLEILLILYVSLLVLFIFPQFFKIVEVDEQLLAIK